MSFGKRRPKLARAHLRPSNPIALQQGRLARQRDRLARLAVVGLAVLATAAIVHGSGPFFTYRLGQRAQTARSASTSTSSSGSEPDPDQHRTPGQGRPGPAVDGQRPGADPRPRRPARATSSTPSPRPRPSTPCPRPSAPGSSPRPSSTTSARPATPPSATRTSAADRPGVRAPDPRRRARPRHPPPHEEGQPLPLGPPRRPARDEAHLVPRDRVMRERLDKPENPVGKRVHRRRSTPALGQGLFTLIADRWPARRRSSSTERHDQQAPRGGPQRPSPTSTRSTAGASCSSSRGRRSARSNCSCSARSTRRRSPTRASTIGARARRAGAVLVLAAAMFALIGYYIHRHEPAIAGDLGKIASICSLIGRWPSAWPGCWRPCPGMPSWCPVAIAAMILAIAYNPHFALMVTFALSLLTTVGHGRGDRPFPGPDGRHVDGRALPPRGPDPDQAHQGRGPLRPRVRWS